MKKKTDEVMIRLSASANNTVSFLQQMWGGKNCDK